MPQYNVIICAKVGFLSKILLSLAKKQHDDMGELGGGGFYKTLICAELSWFNHSWSLKEIREADDGITKAIDVWWWCLEWQKKNKNAFAATKNDFLMPENSLGLLLKFSDIKTAKFAFNLRSMMI